MLGEKAELGLSSRWGWVVLRGVVAILFGVLAIAQPGTIGLTVVLMFAAYSFVSGVAALVSAARGGREGDPRWGTLLLEGLLYVAAGMAAVFWPASIALAFLWVLAFWSIMSGGLEIASAIRLRKIIAHEWTLALAGAVSIAFGALLLLRPLVGAVAVVWWLGAYAMVYGVVMTVLGFRLRSHLNAHKGGELPTGGRLHQPT
jgi:uncharacterized membrane protein HdeD (DUF308 family)